MESQIKFIQEAKNAKLKANDQLGYASRVEFSTLTNTKNGKVEHGTLVRRDGNLAHASTIDYRTYSIVCPYKINFYRPGEEITLLLSPQWDNCQLIHNGVALGNIDKRNTFELFMSFLFNLENIKIASPTTYKKQKTIKSLKHLLGYIFVNQSLIHKAIEWLNNELND